MIPVKGKSQYDDDIKPQFRSSACGPVTVSVILNYWFSGTYPIHVNELYTSLSTTPIGLFRFMMVYKLRRLLGPDWLVKSTNRIDEVMDELQKGHPVAAKFDKYFTLRFFSKPMYAYHWVVITGYEMKNGEIILFFHDNGAPGRESKRRHVSYRKQSSMLRFVLITPPDSQKNPL
ncbi:C39 family peptidase [Bacillus sp. 37MA]|uniref:C39 family peptidase n=1 Tax=Bacillus sp. 37MA TaxID=1132442 RepID=UPI00036E0DDB|nr:C39 family peptidase [Bacillus sp. 37MA]